MKIKVFIARRSDEIEYKFNTFAESEGVVVLYAQTHVVPREDEALAWRDYIVYVFYEEEEKEHIHESGSIA